MSDTVSVFGPVQPRVRKVDLDRPWTWLAAGWSDLLRAPKVSLAYGAALVALLSAKGISAAPVLTVNETATHPHTLARRLLVPGVNRDGVEWPIMVSPMRLAKTPTRVRTPIGGLGADMEDVLAEVGYSRAESGALRDRLLDGGAPEA